MAAILIIDDDPQICKLLTRLFTRQGHGVTSTGTLRQGLDTLFQEAFDVLFLDVNLPDGNGLEAVPAVREHGFPPEIIIMTGEESAEGAEMAMKSRVWDYIPKSGSQKAFRFSLDRALEYRSQKQPGPPPPGPESPAIVGGSRSIKACLDTLAKAALTDAPVLVTGETGTGKELFAKAVHECSSRRDNGFIIVDCAALPEKLVESVLFGHRKGAFTGADTDATGLVQLADRGTLFLDEVGELPLETQKKFLRTLQEKKFRPLGSGKEISSDFRLVSATHRDLAQRVEQGRFREDLYFRITAIRIEVPPLRDRKSDIPALAAHHLERQHTLYGDAPHDLSQDFLEDLLGYDWPGNVRELFNAVDYACSDALGQPMLFAKHLPENIRTFNIKRKLARLKGDKPESTAPPQAPPVSDLPFKPFIESMKQQYLNTLMTRTQGNVPEACRLSGLSRGYLYSLLKKYSLD